MKLPAAHQSPAQSCGAVLAAAVLLQSVCVAVTFLYFTNELKQVGGGRRPGGTPRSPFPYGSLAVLWFFGRGEEGQSQPLAPRRSRARVCAGIRGVC